MVFRKEGFQVPGTFSPAFFLSRKTMRELSIFVDESGSDGLSDRYYLLTVVMHDQSDSIADSGYVSKSVSFLTPSCQVDPHKQVFQIDPARFQGVSKSVSEIPLTRLVRHHFSARKLPRDGNLA